MKMVMVFTFLALRMMLSYSYIANSLSSQNFYILSAVFSFLMFFILTSVIKSSIFRLFFIVLDFFVPFYFLGAVLFGCLLFNFLNKLERKNDLEIEDNFSSLYENEFDTQLKNKKIRIQNEDELKRLKEDAKFIMPYIDILNSNNKALKIDVCLKLSSQTDKHSILLLKNALQDDEYDVRYMSNASLGKIEKKFVSEIDDLTKLITKNPSILDNYIRRADAYLNFHQMKITDRTISEFFLLKALEDLRFVLMNEVASPFIYIKVAYIYNELGEYEHLLNLVIKSTQLDFEQNEINKLLFFAAEAYYNLGNFEMVNKFSNLIDLNIVKYAKIKDSTLYWRTND